MMKFTLPLLLLSISSVAQNIPANKQAVLSSVAKHEKELIRLSDSVWSYAEIAMKEHKSAKILADYAEKQGDLRLMIRAMAEQHELFQQAVKESVQWYKQSLTTAGN